MNLQELANIASVRNHLNLLMSDRHLVTKDNVKVVEQIKINLDKLFLENVINYELSAVKINLNSNGDIKLNSNSDIKLTVADAKKNISVINGGFVMDPNKDAEQLELNISLDKNIDPIKVDTSKPIKAAPAKKKSAKKEVSPEEAAEMKAIQDRIAKAKAEVKTKAKKNGGFKRDNDGDLETEDEG